MKKKVQFRNLARNVMKSTLYQLTIAMIFTGISLANDSNAQDFLNSRVSLKVKDTQLSVVLSMIEKKANIKFVYVPKSIAANRHISATFKQELLSEVLDKFLTPLQITYRVVEDRIILNLIEGAIPSIEKDLKVSPLPQPQEKASAILDIGITGTVTDPVGSVLPGVSVIIKNSTKGTVTNETGNFSIDIPNEGAVLIFSFVGYRSKEISVGSVTRIEVQLVESEQSLEEVVVVGYNSQRKKDITGAVAIVDMKGLKAIPAGSAVQALQGQASGVNVINSGRPGSASTVFIRGITSFGDTKPLVIVDGIQSSLDNISANDIESMQVLKDAGSAAIYGVRGSNGVIVVTTKKGKSGKPVLSYNSYYGIQLPLPGNPYNLVNSEELARLTKQANPSTILFKNGLPDFIYAGPGVSGTAMEGDPSVDPSKYRFDAGNPANNYIIQKINKKGTNWFQETFDPAPITSHNISASGAAEKANYLFSLEYFNQKGTMKSTFMERYSARINTSYNLTKKIRFGQNLYIFYRTNAGGDRGLGDISGLLPVIPVYDINGNFGGAFAGPELGGGHNPVATQYYMKNDKRNIWNVTGNAYAEVDILKNLVARTSIGGTIDNRYNLTFNFNKYYSRQENTGPNRLSESSLYNSNYIWTNTLAYTSMFKDHGLQVLLGSEALKNSGREVGGSANSLFSSEFNYLVLGNGTSNVTNYSSAYVNTLFSIFSRIDYSFKDKYLLGLTIRRDGSSKFGSEKRYGLFPSISAGWQIKSEEFMKDVSFVDELKLRASYGILGSQNNVNASNGFTLYGGGFGNAYYDINGTSNRIQQGFIQTTNGNLQTGWEKNIVSNIGLDMSLFNNSTTVSIEYYKKFINGLLFPQPLPATAGGAQPPIINIGNIQNTGLDISGGYRGSISKNVKFNIGANVTTYKNLVVDIPDPGYFDTDRIRNQEGHPVSSFFGYDILGLYKDLEDVTSSPTQNGAAPGRFKYRDVNGDGKITPDDRTFLGSPNPDFTYGINLGFEYHGFDLSTIFYGSQGNEILNMPRRDLDFFGSLGSTKSRVLLDAWTQENTDSGIPVIEAASSFSTNGANNSYLMENGSYLRLRSAILGYTLNKKWKSKLNLSSARLYLQATNLFTLTKYTGLDPEVGGTSASFGLDYNYYPNNEKSFIFGINVSF